DECAIAAQQCTNEEGCDAACAPDPEATMGCLMYIWNNC
nr:Chain A, Pheromone from Euplotes raikovi Er-13 [Euplotes raikovi]